MAQSKAAFTDKTAVSLRYQCPPSNWLSASERANKAFAQSQLDAAIPPYAEALWIAGDLLRQSVLGATDAKPSDVIAIYVVSVANLAETYRRLNRFIEARDLGKQALARLCMSMRNPSTSTDFRLACLQQLDRAVLELSPFLELDRGIRACHEAVSVAKREATALLQRLAVKNHH